jgi:ABC-type nitrate/sulfonate/bicarbonate transport system permease component
MQGPRHDFWARLSATRWPGVVVLVVLLVLWELSVRLGMVVSLTWPPFTEILQTWWRLIVTGELLVPLGPSLLRMFAGYGIATLVGIGLGLLIGSSRLAYSSLEPLIELIRPIPSPAYIPIAILFLGIGDQMKVLVISVSSLFPILLNTYSGVRAVDPVQIETGLTLGLSPVQIMRQIVLPSATPYIAAGMRVSLGIALILMVLSEMVAGSSGIGYFILEAQRSFRVREMYAGIITLALLGYLLNRLFLLVEGRLLSWHFRSSGIAP